MKRLAALLLACLLRYDTAFAGPINQGAALSLAPGNQVTPIACTDGSGGALIAWLDQRSGPQRIYLHHLLPSQVDPSWPVDGRPLLPGVLSGSQAQPCIVSDDNAGALICWYDSRHGGADIFAAHIMPDGTIDPSLPLEGTPVCTAPSDQYDPVLLSDGSGGAFIVWRDNRNEASLSDLYAHHLLSNGTLDPAWPANGTPVCTATGDQFGVVLVTDDSGGAFANWVDLRSGYEIYGSRLRSAGIDPAVPVNGFGICTASGNQVSVAAVGNGAGGQIVSWHDDRSGNIDVYAQRVNADNSIAWVANGVPVCAAQGSQITPAMCSDGSCLLYTSPSPRDS